MPVPNPLSPNTLVLSEQCVFESDDNRNDSQNAYSDISADEVEFVEQFMPVEVPEVQVQSGEQQRGSVESAAANILCKEQPGFQGDYKLFISISSSVELRQSNAAIQGLIAATIAFPINQI